ncbi:hypothetical protein [Janibacter indicus]|uniref:hypothetical protein n=1 Tax=Janibacter indicus TaxID=857417 RepID=UPI003D9A11D2
MILTAMLVMYAVMFVSAYEWSHVRWSESRMFMALIMGGTTGLIMLAWIVKCDVEGGSVEMHRRLHTTRGLHCTRPSRMASCKVPRRSCYLTISGPWPLALAPQGDRRAALRLAIAGWTLPAGEEWDEHPCGEDDFAEHTQRPGPTARQP